MNSVDPLAQLHPLREPPAIEWWPPALGWWIGLSLIVAFVTARSFLLYRRYKNQRYRRQAITTLDKLLLEPSESGTDTFPLKVNALLKTVALRTYSTRKNEIAMLTGSKWSSFLKTAPYCDRSESANFVKDLYSPADSLYDRREIYTFAKTWIKMHR